MGNRRAATAVAILLTFAGAASLFGEDFRRSYPLPPGGRIRVGNISGDVKIEAYDGETVSAHGIKRGRDSERVQVEDSSSGDRIVLKVRYPEDCDCDATVDFEIRVPASVAYNFERISSVSGNVSVLGAAGQLRAESVGGNVSVRDFKGQLSAASVSGNVNVALERLENAGDMKFSSISGNVVVRAPANLDAAIEMSTVSGSLKTDFPMEVQERRYGPGRSARGRLGAGGRSLRLSTVSGRVSLIRS
jgi:hypothetical protein